MPSSRATSRRASTSVRVTHALFVVHLVAFFVLVLEDDSPWYALTLESLGLGDAAALGERPWTLLSYSLIHRHFLELLLGSGLLLLAGVAVEDRLGTARYLAFYLGAVVLTGLGHVAGVEAGYVDGQLFTGSVGAAGAVLTAYLFLFGHERRVGRVPFPAVYVAAAAAVFATLAGAGHLLERAAVERARIAQRLAYDGETLSTPERLARLRELAEARALRPELAGHTLGLVLGAGLLLAGAYTQRTSERWRLARELRELEAEVDARARVEELLEKISREGIESLTRNERKFLRYASRFYRRPQPLAPGPAA